MAPAYKLTYFNARGAAEPIRFLFAYGNIDYEDNRISREDWPSIKSTTPFGQLPLLERNGVVIPQSVSIARYVGKLVGLGGNDEWENLQIDSIVDTYIDFRQHFGKAFRETDPEKKKELTDNFLNNIIPTFLPKFEEIIKKNNGYLALGRLTWADLFVGSQISLLNKFFDNILEKSYPNFNNFVKKIEGLPQIKKWIEARPETEF